MMVEKMWQSLRVLAARGAGVAAELVAAVGYEERAQQIARWGMLAGGLSFVLEQLPEQPSPEELRAVLWVLGRELEDMGDPTAPLFLGLALSDAPVEVSDLRERCAEWMEDAASLEAADKVAPVWRLLDSLAGANRP